MIQKALRQHKRIAYRRNPMFEQTRGVKIAGYIGLGYLAFTILLSGFFLEKICLKIRPDSTAIDTFNSILFYFLLFDLTLKLFFKKNRSMQIAPYLTLPIKRNRLFDFLLRKEFHHMMNLYGVLLILPFAFIAVPPVYGIIGAFGLILALYLLSITVSLLVSIINVCTDKIWYKKLIPILIISGMCVTVFFTNIPFDSYSREGGDLLLRFNPVVWLTLIILSPLLWRLNRREMRNMVYRELQGVDSDNSGIFINIPFLERMGEIGQLMNLELKLSLRPKQVRWQTFTCIASFLFGISQFFLYEEIYLYDWSYFPRIFWTGFMIGGIGLYSSQFQYTAESSYFDGLMARKHAFIKLMRAKYYIYLVITTIFFILSLSLIFLEKATFLFLFAVYVHFCGLVYFIMFQSGVYNKKYFDIFASKLMTFRSPSSNQLAITFGAMFISPIPVAILAMISSQLVANIFMMIVGIAFIIGSNRWLKWTCNRVMARKYVIMEGFRSNG